MISQAVSHISFLESSFTFYGNHEKLYIFITIFTLFKFNHIHLYLHTRYTSVRHISLGLQSVFCSQLEALNGKAKIMTGSRRVFKAKTALFPLLFALIREKKPNISGLCNLGLNR